MAGRCSTTAVATPTRNRSSVTTLTMSPLGQEALDDPATSPALVARMLRDIAKSNRWFGGRRAVRAGLAELVGPEDRGTTLSLLDIGTGAGDLPQDAVRWATRRGITIRPLGVERIPAAALLAQSNGIPVLLGCAGALPLRPKSVDLVVMSQLLHHFDRDSAIELLAACDSIARRGVVIADLRPSPLAAFGYRLAGPMLGMHPLTVSDGVLSLARGFTPEALGMMIHEATDRTVLPWTMTGARVVAAWRTAP